MKTTFLTWSNCTFFSQGARWQLTFLFLLFILVSHNSLAQNKLWDKTYGGSNPEELSVLVATPDGGYLLGGSSLSDKGGDKSEDSRDRDSYISNPVGDFWVVKLNAEGNKVWDKTYGGDDNDKLKAIVPTLDGGYLLGGTSQSGKNCDKTESNRGEFDANGQITTDFWVLKIDANGKKLWDKTLGGDDDDELSAIVATPDGGFLLGGLSETGKNGDKSEISKGLSDYWIVKINATGAKIWDKALGGNNGDGLTTMLVTPDGGYLLGGSSGSDKSGDKSEAKMGFWVLKIDASGKKIWDKTYSGGGTLLATPDGGYLIGGTAGHGKGGDKTTNYAGYWILKIKANGEKVWDKSYGGSTYDSFGDMVTTPDGGFLLAGVSHRGKGGDKTEDKKGYWVIKIKENGAKVWEKTFGSVDGTTGSYLQLVRVVNTGKTFLLGGTTYLGISGDKSEVSRGGTDYWVVKMEDVTDVNKKRQTISFTSSLLTKSLNSAPFKLLAQASSGLPVTFALVSGSAILQGDVLTLTGVGKVIVKATQPGDATYAAAPELTQTILVDPVTPITKIWDKRFGGNNYDGLTAMVATPDNGYLLAGNSSSGNTGDKSATRGGYWLVNIDKNGTKIWDVTIDAAGDLGGILSSVIATPDGGYLLGGTSLYDFSTVYRVIKINSTGNIEWDKGFSRGDYNSLDALVITMDGGYLVGGHSSVGINGDYDYWVIRIDNQGNKIWDRAYGGNDHEDLSTLLATSDGGFLLGGSSSSGKSGDKSEANKGTLNQFGSLSSDYWLVKIDALGKKLWDKTVGSNQQDLLRVTITTADGGYLLGGSSTSGKSGDKSEVNKGTPDANGFFTPDYWVVKTDAQGNKIWDKTFGNDGSDGLVTTVATIDGGYLLGGSSTSGIGQDKSGEYRGGQFSGDYWIVKIDNSGKKLWDKTFGGDNTENFSSLVATQDGYYLLGGISYSGANGDKSEPLRGTGSTLKGDYWIVKIKEEQPTRATWTMRYGGSGTDNLTSTIKTRDGGYLAGGYTNSGVSGDKTQNSQGKNDYWIVKSDQNGNKLWDKRYGGSGQDYLNRVIQTQDGGYLLAGSSFSAKSGDKTEASRGGRDFWLVKTDKQGTQEWDKTYGGSGEDELVKVIQLSSGEYVLAGTSHSPVSGDKSQASQGGSDYWLVKIDQTGSKLWDQRYGGTLTEELGSFIETADGGFLLGGSSDSNTSGDKKENSRGYADFWVVKTNAQGTVEWENTYGGADTDQAYSIGQVPGSNYYMAGWSFSGKSGDKSQASQGGKDYWLVTLDQQGNKLWDRTFGGSQDDELRASTFTSQGYYVLAGHSYSGKSGDKTQASQGESDYWVVAVDQDGNQVLDQRYGGSEKEELRTVTQTRDGGLLLAGRSNSGVSGDRTQTSQGNTDYWLVKVAPLTTSSIAARQATLTEAVLSSGELNSLSAYPNPFPDKVTIRFTLPATQPTTVKVLDSQGREIKSLFNGEAQAKQTYQVEWQAGQQASGMYLLQLQTPTHQNTQKILLNK